MWPAPLWPAPTPLCEPPPTTLPCLPVPHPPPQVPFLVTLFPKPEDADGPAAAGAGAKAEAGPKGGVPIAIQPYQGPMKYAYISRFLQLVALQLG